MCVLFGYFGGEVFNFALKRNVSNLCLARAIETAARGKVHHAVIVHKCRCQVADTMMMPQNRRSALKLYNII